MRVVIADDHALFRSSLRTVLENRGIEVIGEAGTGAEAIQVSRDCHPDVVLMDLGAPGMGGLEAIARLHGEQPSVQPVVLTAELDDEHLFGALKAGAKGYMTKDLETEEFLELLEGLERGEPALPPTVCQKVLAWFADAGNRDWEAVDPNSLTGRELQVLQFMVDGVTSSRSLARELEVSENTVKFHVRNILEKLHLHNRAQAVSFALRSGIVPTREQR